MKWGNGMIVRGMIRYDMAWLGGRARYAKYSYLQQEKAMFLVVGCTIVIFYILPSVVDAWRSGLAKGMRCFAFTLILGWTTTSSL